MANFEKDFEKYDESLEKTKAIYSGLLGISMDGQRQVNHLTRNGYVYVRLRDNLSEVVQAFNDKVSPVYNFPVLIQRRNTGWVVLGRDIDRYKNWGTSAPFLPTHGDQHSFNRDGSGGGDTVFVYPDQFMPLLCYPSGTLGSGNVLVAPYVLQRGANFVYVGNTGTKSLLTYKPTNNQAILGLVVLNTDSGNPELLINSGTPFSASITGSSQLAPYIPYPASNQEPLYAVRLVSGTTSILWSNLYNARQFVGGGSSSSVSLHGIDETTYHSGTLNSTKVYMPGVDEALKNYSLATDFTIRGSAGVTIGQQVDYITATGTQSINVSDGVGYIRTSNAQNGDLVFCEWQASGSISIPSPAAGLETVRFIGVAYNGGNPQITVRTTFNWNWFDDFPLGRVSYDGQTLHILNTYAHAEDTANLARKFLRLVLPFQREQAPEGSGGLELLTSGQSLGMSSGKLWHGFNNFTMTAISTGTAFFTAYRDGAGGFNKTGTVTQFPNTEYDDGSGVLVTMTNNRHACLWVYLDVADNGLNVVYGRDQYTSTTLAQAETIPATVPDHLNYQGRLIARIIFQKSATSASIVESAWLSEFIGSAGGGSTYTPPTYVTGSIPYALPDGTLTEDNQKFSWDSLNGALWIGHKPPTDFQNPQLPLFITATGSNGSVGFGIAVFGTGTLGSPSSILNGYRSRGTRDAPTPVQKGDALYSLIGGGYDGATWQNSTRIRSYADQDFITGTALASRLDFEVTPSGSATRAVIAQLRGDGFDLKNTGTYNVNGVPHTHASSGGITLQEAWAWLG